MLALIAAGLKALYALSGLERLFSSIRDRRAGRAEQRAEDQQELIETQCRELEAAQNAPRDRRDLLDQLDKGEF